MKAKQFRYQAKERMLVSLPVTLAGEVRRVAAGRRSSISALIAVAAARDLGIDPATFGIAPINITKFEPETPKS